MITRQMTTKASNEHQNYIYYITFTNSEHLDTPSALNTYAISKHDSLPHLLDHIPIYFM